MAAQSPDYSPVPSPGSFLPSAEVKNPITIQVGERRFVTTSTTLTEESRYFASLLSGRWSSSTQADGSYFVDADAVVFEHVLRYLRHGIFPVFYDRSKGHDYSLYQALLGQARYFQIAQLEKWLEDKTYLKAIEVTHSLAQIEYPDAAAGIVSTADTEVEYHPEWRTKKVYICPRGIYVHRGKPDVCGIACRRARGDADDEFVDEQELKIVRITKKTAFNRQICERGAQLPL